MLAFDPPAAELGQAGLDLLARGELHSHRPHLPSSALADPREVSRVAHAGQQVNVALGELLNERAADAAVGPGYENAESGKVHGRTDSRFGPC